MADGSGTDPDQRFQPIAPFINHGNAQLQPIAPLSSSTLAHDYGEANQTGEPEVASTILFGIPYDAIHQMIQQPYDATWAQSWGIDEETLSSYPLPPGQTYQTFEAMYNNGVIKKDDELYCLCTYTIGDVTFQLEKVAKIMGDKRVQDNRGRTTWNRKRPSLSIMSGGIYYTDVAACFGIRDIAQAFEEVLPKEAEYGHHKKPKESPRCFQGIRMRRDTVDLGTLHQVRHAWDVWRFEMDSWASTYGIKYRQKRNKRTSYYVDEAYIGRFGSFQTPIGESRIPASDSTDHSSKRQCVPYDYVHSYGNCVAAPPNPSTNVNLNTDHYWYAGNYWPAHTDPLAAFPSTNDRFDGHSSVPNALGTPDTTTAAPSNTQYYPSSMGPSMASPYSNGHPDSYSPVPSLHTLPGNRAMPAAPPATPYYLADHEHRLTYGSVGCPESPRPDRH
ncbi:MAG: hypothetical protein Q9218_001364 [Villophora microphyllina]